MHFLAVVDFTKLGTFSQQNINAHAQWLAHILGKNPLRNLSCVLFADVLHPWLFLLYWFPSPTKTHVLWILRIHRSGDRSFVVWCNAWLNSQRRLEDRKEKQNISYVFSFKVSVFVTFPGIVPGRLRTSWSSTTWSSGPSTWTSHWMAFMATVSSRHRTHHGWLCVITHCLQKVSCTGFRGQATKIRTPRARWPKKIPMCVLF